jgi:hypothetical protein
MGGQEIVGNDPGDYDLVVKVVEFDADLAATFLTHNIDNRALKLASLERLGLDMEAGDFSLTGETIIIDKNGHVRNGQHRLMACKQMGARFTCLVVWGVEPSAFRHMDSGVVRTAADVFDIDGTPNPVETASLLKVIARKRDTGAPYRQGGIATTQAELDKLYLSLDQAFFHEVIDQVKSLPSPRQIGLTPTWVAWLYWSMAKDDQRDKAAAYAFIIGLVEDKDITDEAGRSYGDTSPIRIVRKQIIGNAAVGKKDRKPDKNRLAWCIKAWNDWRTGRERKPRSYYTFARGEDFPEPI